MTEQPLRPATSDELEQTLAHHLCHDGKKAFRVSSEFMARITAAHLARALDTAGYVVMRKPPGDTTAVVGSRRYP